MERTDGGTSRARRRSYCGRFADGWLPSSGRALDVGCGLGREAVHLHRLGWRVAGLDLSAVALITATAQNPGPAYVRADLRQTPFRSSSIDVCL